MYDAVFHAEDATEVSVVRPENREQAHDPDLVGELEKASGIFMTGGNQLKNSARSSAGLRAATASSQRTSGAR